jgi:predicted permease
MGYYNNADDLDINGYTTPPGQPGPGSQYVVVSSEYLHTLRIPLLRGRDFTDADRATAPYVAVLNETMARKYWPTLDPIGRTFTLASDRAHAITVVGVAADARYNKVTGPMQSTFFLPLAQHADSASLQTLQVRAQGDAAAMIPGIERVIAGLTPDLPVFDVKTMMQALHTLNGLMFFQIGAGLAIALGALGLVLSVVGVYGVISYSASQRTQEIGLRMALGAQSHDVLWMVMRQGSIIVGGGLVVGLVCAFASGQLVRSFLVVSPNDPLTYGLVSLLLTLVALAACYVPARRSANVDPMIALRAE